MSNSPAIGCILGTAVGDALGLPYEGLSKRRAARLLGPPDRYRFFLRYGMVSDDTEHTCMVAQALIRSNGDGEVFERDLSRRLRRWFLLMPAGVGLATARACVKLCVGLSPSTSGVFSAGNGPAMRVAVLGVFADDLGQLKDLVRRCTRITHTDPKAEFGALGIATAAFLASQDREIGPNEYLSTLESLLPDDEASAFVELMRKAVRSVERREPTGTFASNIGLEKAVGGYVYHCVPVVIHCWLSHQEDFRGALTTIIECGGDTDTNAAMLGGIVGAGGGVEAIPDEWLRSLIDRPMSVRWMKSLGEQLTHVKASGQSIVPVQCPLVFGLIRNLFFLVVVLGHGLRRSLPPY